MYLQVYKHLNNKKLDRIKACYGFTLAEVLVTLAIIGVVAALTMPTLMQSIQDNQYKSAAKKATSVFMQVAMKLVSDKNGSLLGVFTGSTDLANTLTSYLAVAKTCTLGNAMGADKCFESSFKYLNGTDYPFAAAMSVGSAGLILNDGTLVLVYGEDGTTKVNTCTVEGSTTCAGLIFDINGFKGPNKVGYDIYTLNLDRDRLSYPGPPMAPDNDCVFPPNAGWNDVSNEGWTCIKQRIQQ